MMPMLPQDDNLAFCLARAGASVVPGTCLKHSSAAGSQLLAVSEASLFIHIEDGVQLAHITAAELLVSVSAWAGHTAFLGSLPCTHASLPPRPCTQINSHASPPSVHAPVAGEPPLPGRLRHSAAHHQREAHGGGWVMARAICLRGMVGIWCCLSLACVREGPLLSLHAQSNSNKKGSSCSSG